MFNLLCFACESTSLIRETRDEGEKTAERKLRLCLCAKIPIYPQYRKRHTTSAAFIFLCSTKSQKESEKDRKTEQKSSTQYIYKTVTSVTTISKITNARLKENADNYYSTPILIRKPFSHSRRRKNSVDTREKSKF